MSAARKLAIRSLAYDWAANGTHSRWWTAPELLKVVRTFWPGKVGADGKVVPFNSLPAIDRWLRKDKRKTAVGEGIKHPLDIETLLKAERAEIVEMFKDEPSLVEAAGGKFKFEPAWYDELKVEAVELEETAGFGPSTICSIARRIYVRHKKDSVDAVPPELDWMPSTDWGLWFLHKHMDYVVRRVVTEPISPEAAAKQRELHEINIDRICIDLLEKGVPLWAIYALDEAGCFLWPSTHYVWIKKGSDRATRANSDDKRQVTIGIVHNAEGQIIFIQVCVFAIPV